MDIPIACTLSTDELGDRRALWESIDGDIVGRERQPDGFKIMYAASPQVRRLLPSLVDAESRCCSFASWRITGGDTSWVLLVNGPQDGIEALAHEFGVF